MTERKVSYALKKIKQCQDCGCDIEALIRSYFLNIELIRYIQSSLSPTYNVKDKKVKPMVRDFLNEISNHPEFKAVIQKKNLKTVRPWIDKMDGFFKSMKAGHYEKPDKLQIEAQRIFGILNLSASKLFISARPVKHLRVAHRNSA
jgi:hypothetical protein